ncbi:hypothetical protein CMI47_18095 [Candidatus Pacearchaeota archaeon]|nr:hypothetical protein [Candidatus Pacearchaeota archaeon]
MDSLSPAQRILVARATAAAAKGDKLSAGLHNVPAFTVTVDGGELSVSEDETYTPTVSVPLLATLTIALHRAGFQRDGIAALILDAATIAIGNDDKVGDELETTIAYVATEVKALQARLAAGLPKKVRKGKVRVNRAELSGE